MLKDSIVEEMGVGGIPQEDIESVKSAAEFYRAQKRIWGLARYLAAAYNLGRPIDVIEAALKAYAAALATREEAKHAEEEV